MASREHYERERFYERERDNPDDRQAYYRSPPPEAQRGPLAYNRYDRGDRGERSGREPRPAGGEIVRERRYYEEDEQRYVAPSRDRHPPPPARDSPRESMPAAPSRRPALMLRRQSSLDTFDRRPPARYYEYQKREEIGPPARREAYGPPARREDYRSQARPEEYGPPARREEYHPQARREEYGPPARREDDSPALRVPSPPPPRSRPIGFPPAMTRPSPASVPRAHTFDNLEYYEDARTTEVDRVSGNGEVRVREREYVSSQRTRDPSVESRARQREPEKRDRGRAPNPPSDAVSATAATPSTAPAASSARAPSSSRSSSSGSSSRSSSNSGGTAGRSEYPRKGKTRIPSKLISLRALIDLGYPFIEQGNAVIVQRALGQGNIDEILKLSEQYRKKAEREATQGLDRREKKNEEHENGKEGREDDASSSALDNLAVATAAATSAAVAAAMVSTASSRPRPVVIEAARPRSPMSSEYSQSPTVAMTRTTDLVRFRDAESDASSIISETSTITPVTTGPLIIVPRESSDPIPIGPAALVARPRRHSLSIASRSRSHARPRSRSRARPRSRARGDIRAEIRALEAELHGHHRRSNVATSTDVVRAERLSNGEVVMYEEQVERVEDGWRGARIERDRRGRMSLSLPKYVVR